MEDTKFDGKLGGYRFGWEVLEDTAIEVRVLLLPFGCCTLVGNSITNTGPLDAASMQYVFLRRADNMSRCHIFVSMIASITSEDASLLVRWRTMSRVFSEAQNLDTFLRGSVLACEVCEQSWLVTAPAWCLGWNRSCVSLMGPCLG